MSFWKNKWCGESTLCTSFPSLFALAVNKEATVVDVWDDSRVGGGEPLFHEIF